MFETIIKLLTIGLWGMAILLFVGSIGVSIRNLIRGDCLDRIRAVIGLGLAFVVFSRCYKWLDSIVWSMLFTGMEIFFVSLSGCSIDNTPSKPAKGPGPIEESLTDFVDLYTKKQILEETIEEAIRKSK